MPSGDRACDVVWVDEWRGGLEADQRRYDICAGTPETCFVRYLITLHGISDHDFLIVGEVSMLEHVKTQFNERRLVKSANITSWLDGYEREGHFSQANNFDAAHSFDTEAMKRPRSTDDPRPDDALEI